MQARLGWSGVYLPGRVASFLAWVTYDRLAWVYFPGRVAGYLRGSRTVSSRVHARP
jgi:hypothetical protein